MLDGTWVHVGDNEMIEIDAHIDHLTGQNVIDMRDDATAEMFKSAMLKMLRELKRRVIEETGQ